MIFRLKFFRDYKIGRRADRHGRFIKINCLFLSEFLFINFLKRTGDEDEDENPDSE
jgi:hypothetical protein